VLREQLHTLAELCVLVDMPIRTVRYYVQNGLVDRPDGETRAARYGQKQIEQLLLIKKWTNAGVSLDRIRELLHGADEPVPPRNRRFGAIEVKSHLFVSNGVEVVIDPGHAQLSPEQVREFSRGVMALFKQVAESSVGADDLKKSHPGSNQSQGEKNE